MEAADPEVEAADPEVDSHCSFDPSCLILSFAPKGQALPSSEVGRSAALPCCYETSVTTEDAFAAGRQVYSIRIGITLG